MNLLQICRTATNRASGDWALTIAKDSHSDEQSRHWIDRLAKPTDARGRWSSRTSLTTAGGHDKTRTGIIHQHRQWWQVIASSSKIYQFWRRLLPLAMASRWTTRKWICYLDSRLISENSTTNCFGSHWWRNVGKCGRLTLSPPIPLWLYTVSYWSNPPFLTFDIRALWRSGLSARVPECQKFKNGGLDQSSSS